MIRVACGDVPAPARPALSLRAAAVRAVCSRVDRVRRVAPDSEEAASAIGCAWPETGLAARGVRARAHCRSDQPLTGHGERPGGRPHRALPGAAALVALPSLPRRRRRKVGAHATSTRCDVNRSRGGPRVGHPGQAHGPEAVAPGLQRSPREPAQAEARSSAAALCLPGVRDTTRSLGPESSASQGQQVPPAPVCVLVPSRNDPPGSYELGGPVVPWSKSVSSPAAALTL